MHHTNHTPYIHNKPIKRCWSITTLIHCNDDAPAMMHHIDASWRLCITVPIHHQKIIVYGKISTHSNVTTLISIYIRKSGKLFEYFEAPLLVTDGAHANNICTSRNTVSNWKKLRGLIITWWRHQMQTFSALLSLCGEFTGLRWIPRTKASDAELWSFLWSALE